MVGAWQQWERLQSHAHASTSDAAGARQLPSCSAKSHASKRLFEKLQHRQFSSRQCAYAAGSDRSSWSHEMSWADYSLGELRSRSSFSQSGISGYDYSVYQQMSAEQLTEEHLWGRLAPSLVYLPEEDRFQVKQALRFASRAHAGQKRKSGEPFITHPVEVTRILAELCMDRDSLIAGILHDTVEDNPDSITFEEIGFLFGTDVRTIVQGETKFSKLGQLSGSKGKPVDVKARDLQHLFLAMTKEVRIIVVKLADRLHNMRTLGSLAEHKQRKIANETLQVFAPLARLLGLYGIKEELEELGFRYSKPHKYATLRRHLNHLADEYEPVIQQARQTLEDVLNSDDYLRQRANPVRVIASQKSVYSLQRKSEESGSPAADVTCVSQLCVIIPQRDDQDAFLYGTGSQLCYHIMGLVHTMWAPVPGSIKDYIATPKRNGYQSLHTTVLPLGSTPLVPLEVLIRTCKMQELADFGIAGETWGAREAGGGRAAESSRNESTQSTSKTSEQSFSPVLHLATNEKPKAMVVDMLRMLPKLMGLNHDLVTGNALLTANGTVMQAPRLGVNGYRANGVHSKVVAKAALLANRPASDSDDLLKITSTKKAPSGGVRLDREVMKRREHWLKSIIEWQREFVDSLTAREFVDGITDDLLGRGVFVFTPSGDLLRLPKDSTAVDFAYHVHTDVGNQMVGAKVNGKLVNPEHLLQNAEVVEILTYNGPPTTLAVSRHFEWAKFVKSRTARHKLAKFLKDNWSLLRQSNGRSVVADSNATDLATSNTQNSNDEMSNSSSPSRESQIGTSTNPEQNRQQYKVPATESSVNQPMQLTLEGPDRPSLLVEIAQVIGQQEHSIKSFSQAEGSSPDTLQLQFQIHGNSMRRDKLVKELETLATTLGFTVLDFRI